MATSAKRRRNTDALTTGQVAVVCRVCPRTVTKWHDKGKLKGFRVPLGDARRFTVTDVLRFMREYGLPTDLLTGGVVVVTVGDVPAHTSDVAETVNVRTTAEAAVVIGSKPVHVLAVDVSVGVGAAIDLLTAARSFALKAIVVTAEQTTADEVDRLATAGFIVTDRGGFALVLGELASQVSSPVPVPTYYAEHS